MFCWSHGLVLARGNERKTGSLALTINRSLHNGIR